MWLDWTKSSNAAPFIQILPILASQIQTRKTRKKEFLTFKMPEGSHEKQMKNLALMKPFLWKTKYFLIKIERKREILAKISIFCEQIYDSFYSIPVLIIEWNFVLCVLSNRIIVARCNNVPIAFWLTSNMLFKSARGIQKKTFR